MTALGLLLLALAVGVALWFGAATPLGAVVFQLDPPLLNTLQAGVQRRLAPELWDSVILPVLQAPAWGMPAALGALFLLFGLVRQRRHA